MASKLWELLLSMGLGVVVVCVELAYRQPLYDYSLDMIADWQKGHTGATRGFYKFVSYFGDEMGIAALFICVYNFVSRPTFLKVCLAFSVAENLMCFLKLFYHNPRPFFSSYRVEALSCSKGYGNPSGHCLCVAALYGTVWLLSFAIPNDDPQSRSILPKGWAKLTAMWTSLLLLIALVVLVFFSRLNLGVHSLNQVIYGLTIGLWVAYTFAFAIRDYANTHLVSFASLKDRCMFQGCAIIVLIVSLGLQVLNAVLYATLKDREEFLDPDWVIEVQRKCPNLFTDTPPIENSFQGGVHASLYVLIYYAHIISIRCFPSAYLNWNGEMPLWKLLVRLLVIGAVLGICLIPYFAVSSASFGVVIGVGIILSNILIAFVGIPGCDWVCMYLSLVPSPPPSGNPTLQPSPPNDHV